MIKTLTGNQDPCDFKKLDYLKCQMTKLQRSYNKQIAGGVIVIFVVFGVNWP